MSLTEEKIGGCVFRIHDFIPTFNKFAGKLCHGLQIHVTDPERYFPVGVAIEIIEFDHRIICRGRLEIQSTSL